MSNSIYLAGPITGLSYEECTKWREEVAQALAPYDVRCMSPMRGKRYLDKGDQTIGDIPRRDVHKVGRGMSTQDAIVARDRRDVIEADLLFVNLLGAKEVSSGTVIELGWADMCRTPTLVLMEPEGNIHDRALVRGVTNFRGYSVEEGINIAKAFFDY